MKTLLIDDVREIKVDQVCRTPEGGIMALKYGGPWDELYLDHDMGYFPPIVEGEEYGDTPQLKFTADGYGVCRFLEIYPEYKPKKIIIVSSNPSGVKMMAAALRNIYTGAIGDRQFFDIAK